MRQPFGSGREEGAARPFIAASQADVREFFGEAFDCSKSTTSTSRIAREQKDRRFIQTDAGKVSQAEGAQFVLFSLFGEGKSRFGA